MTWLSKILPAVVALRLLWVTPWVDLVTVAQALHWFDVERFFLECARVLVPGGVLAVLTYGQLHVDGATVDRVVQHYYHDIVGPYWPAERALVDSGYASVSFPWPQLAAPVFEMEAWWTLPDLLGYMGTWSSTHGVTTLPFSILLKHLSGLLSHERIHI